MAMERMKGCGKAMSWFLLNYRSAKVHLCGRFGASPCSGPVTGGAPKSAKHCTCLPANIYRQKNGLERTQAPSHRNKASKPEVVQNANNSLHDL
jgi:hypothetical protein